MADGGRDLLAALREVEAERIAEGMPVGAQRRVGVHLRGELGEPVVQWGASRFAERCRSGWFPMAAFIAGAALALLVVALGSWADPEAPSVASRALARSVGMFAVDGEHCVVDDDDPRRTVLSGSCRLTAEHMVVTTWRDTTLTTRGRSIRIHRGQALFDVEKVRPGHPSIRVGVSHGEIEVVGTRFEVVQEESDGHVDLFEGKIRFHGPDRVADVSPGQRFAWGGALESPEAVPPAAHVAVDDETIEILSDEPATPRRTKARRATRSPREAAALIERVEQLRRAGESASAAKMLRDALEKGGWGRRTAQVLSYELGELLHRHVGDAQGACRHFAAHQRRYRNGRYQDAIDRTRSRLKCPPATRP